MNNKKWT